MENTFNFDEIRPFYDSELQSAFEKLTTDVEFMGLIQKLFPQIPLDKLELQLKNTNSKNNFQQELAKLHRNRRKFLGEQVSIYRANYFPGRSFPLPWQQL